MNENLFSFSAISGQGEQPKFDSTAFDLGSDVNAPPPPAAVVPPAAPAPSAAAPVANAPAFAAAAPVVTAPAPAAAAPMATAPAPAAAAPVATATAPAAAAPMATAPAPAAAAPVVTATAPAASAPVVTAPAPAATTADAANNVVPFAPPAQESNEGENPLLAMMDLQETKNVQAANASLFAQLPQFSYNGTTEVIENLDQTFEELREAKENQNRRIQTRNRNLERISGWAEKIHDKKAGLHCQAVCHHEAKRDRPLQGGVSYNGGGRGLRENHYVHPFC